MTYNGYFVLCYHDNSGFARSHCMLLFKHEFVTIFSALQVSFGEGLMGLSLKNVDGRAEVSRVEAGENSRRTISLESRIAPFCAWQ